MPAITRSGRNVVVLIVFVALLLDNILVTCIVPILPNYFRDQRQSALVPINDHNNTQTTTPGLLHLSPQSTSTANLSHVLPVAQILDDENSTDPGENTQMGILIGTKTFVQLIANFGVGHITCRVGYTIPLFSGFVILVVSTSLFALANGYYLLLAARAVQGIGTALSTTSGMGLLAQLFPDQRERGLAQTLAFSGLAFGVLIGPPYGGVLYDYTGSKEIPILILAGVALMEGVLQLFAIRPRFQPDEKEGNSFLKLLSDPYILVTVVTITMSSLTLAVLEPVLPIWMFHTMDAPAWLQGVAFIPQTLAYLLFLQIFGTIAHQCNCYDVSDRWVSAFIGALLLGSSIAMVPFCNDIYKLIVPLVVNGIGLALVICSMLPHVRYLVDQHHQQVYGSAYALADNAFCLAFAIGPAISGPMVDSVGFSWTLVSMGALSVISAPLVCFLRQVPARETVRKVEERTPLLMTKTVAFSASTNQRLRPNDYVTVSN